MKAVILARVSTMRQEKEGLSLEDIQLPMLRDYAKENGFDVEKEFVFSESADSKIRKKFNEMISFAKKSKEIKAIICYRVDRITRNFRDAVLIDELRLEHGKEIHFVHDRLVICKDTIGRDITDWDTKVYLAKQFLNRLKEDAVISAQRKLEMGEWPEKAPIGYLNKTLEANKKDVILDNDRKRLVLKAFELYASEQYGLPQIVKILEDEGLRNNTKAGKPVKKSQLSNILSNPFYYGEMEYNGKLYPHRYEKLIDRWLFEKCKAIRDGRSGTKIKYASKPFVFRGMIRCADCGCLVGKDPKKGINYCICSQYKGKHGALRVTEEELIKQVAEAFKNIKVPDDVLLDQRKRVMEMYQAEQELYESSIEQFQKEYEKNKAKLKKLWHDNADGSITDAMYDEIFSEITERQEFLENKMKNYKEADEEFKMSCLFLLRLANRAYEIFISSKPERQARLITFVLSNLRLKGKKLLWNYKKPFDAMALCSKNNNWLPELDSNQ